MSISGVIPIRIYRSLRREYARMEISVTRCIPTPVTVHQILVFVFDAEVITPQKITIAIVHIHKHIDRITFRFIAVNNPCMTSTARSMIPSGINGMASIDILFDGTPCISLYPVGMIAVRLQYSLCIGIVSHTSITTIMHSKIYAESFDKSCNYCSGLSRKRPSVFIFFENAPIQFYPGIIWKHSVICRIFMKRHNLQHCNRQAASRSMFVWRITFRHEFVKRSTLSPSNLHMRAGCRIGLPPVMKSTVHHGRIGGIGRRPGVGASAARIGIDRRIGIGQRIPQ